LLIECVSIWVKLFNGSDSIILTGHNHRRPRVLKRTALLIHGTSGCFLWKRIQKLDEHINVDLATWELVTSEIQDSFDGRVSHFVSVLAKVEFGMTYSLLSLRKYKLQNRHFWLEFVFVQVEIQSSLHFENVVYLGFVSVWIDDARF